ncbi:MAG: hypothetical protein J1F61_06405 [Clostridiales bacterium]|nr:hypothetical protein [Clostridiales bacterium]
MIKSYKGMEAKKTTSSSPLPAGGYVAKIINAKVESYSWGEVLVVALDIAEGEYKDFFKTQYDANTNEDKKWKGTFRLTVPDENSQYFESNKRMFNNFIYALEDSNVGYHYDCDEKNLKGKLFGVLYRNKEFETSNGDCLWTTECAGSTDVSSIRSGDFRLPKDKPLKNKSQTDQNDFTAIGDGDDLPF